MTAVKNIAARFASGPNGLYLALQAGGGFLLVAGFTGPWIYGTIGRNNDFGWLPVWGLLVQFIPANLFVLAGVAHCFSYLEFTYRRGRRVLGGLLKWVAAFFVLLALPLAWLVRDFSGRSRTALLEEGTLGWGTWLALLGLVVQVAAFRLRIYRLKRGNEEIRRG